MKDGYEDEVPLARRRELHAEYPGLFPAPSEDEIPPPVVSTPSLEEIQAWEREGGCEATDGCWVEPDGTCEHGHESWMLHLGLI